MTGSLRIKNGVYYAVISYKDNFGRFKQKWISTKLKIRGNKKLAQQILEQEMENFKYHKDDNANVKRENNIIFMV